MHDPHSHARPVEQLAADFETHLERGLSAAEAAARLARDGSNELTERPRPGFWALLAAQFNNYLVIILIVAAAVSLALGEWVDSVAIAVIVALNAVVGVIQESKAEQALAALKRMAAPLVQVVRGGQQITIAGRELVAGDVVMLEAGNFVPADLRLIESFNLKVEEASLTGESVPVDKTAAIVLDRDIPLGDRRNSAFMGTVVAYGRGRGLVTGTGMNTQIGLIAQMLQAYEDEATPLQRKLSHLGKVLGTICLGICAAVFVWGLVRDAHVARAFQGDFGGWLASQQAVIVTLFMTAVSLAIAAVPEGLPAIVTICLALGMQRMIRHHALIRKLPAVETLGCATVVCTDKTGTLTQNQMTVVQAWAGGRHLRVTGEGYAPEGEFFDADQRMDARSDPDVAALLQAAACCSDAQLVAGEADEAREGRQRGWRIVGDPTEGAMVVAAAKGGFRQDQLREVLPRVQEIPFDSDRKRMATLHRNDSGTGLFPARVAFVKGAPDVVLELCTHLLDDGTPEPLTAAMRREILERNHEMAGDALRVLAVAFRPLDEIPSEPTPEAVERDLVFVGLLGMIDPPRPEVVEALKVARGAGLKTVMVTGDYKDTAEAIARDIGLLTPRGLVLTGADLDRLSDAELAAKAHQVDVCCRVSPAHKTRIVEALKSSGHVVAMTGDGVNDAPALKRANIGVAMGITGTDVAKQTADMVLTDDNFASIVAAVEQGRIIYANIRKFVYFLLACNVGEILIVFGAMLFGMPLPLKPVQLLWLNLVSDGAPALALGLEKGDPDTMKQPPRSPAEPVINRDMAIGIGVVGVVDMVAMLLLFAIAMARYPDQLAAAQTMVFVALCTSELIRAFAARSEYHSVFTLGFASNRWMLAAVASSFVLVLAVVYIPFIAPFFDAVPLAAGDWLLMAPFFFASPVAMELLKLRFRRRARAAAAAAAPVSPQPKEVHAMKRILIPVHDSPNAMRAVQHAVGRFLQDPALEVHLINVQPRFNKDVAHFASAQSRHDYHREQAEQALAPARRKLDEHSIPYAVHAETGDRAKCIADAARRLHCDEIVMAAGRKNALTRFVEDSLVDHVIELSAVPVEVIPGDAMTPLERYGIPAALAAAAAVAIAAID